VANGGNAITSSGICWSINPNPTLLDSINANGNINGNTSLNLINLSPGTTYYVRAYATNSGGTAYGNQLVFTTGAALPTLSTLNASNITFNSAIVGGNVTNDGGAPVTQRGVCWSTTQNPTLANSSLIIGSGLGSFNDTITGLSGNTTYYVRAFATNSSGTAYGNQISFQTFNSPSAIQCSGATNVAYPLVTNPPVTVGGWVSVLVNQQVIISQQTTQPFIACGGGGASEFINPVGTNVISSCCCSCNGNCQIMSETISFNNPGVYTIQIKCGNIMYSLCSLTIVVN
jgi:hypothetical protein